MTFIEERIKRLEDIAEAHKFELDYLREQFANHIAKKLEV